MKFLFILKSNTLILFILQCIFVFNVFAETVHKVTILADEYYPPYSYVENNELKGIYIDIVKEAAKRLKPSYEVNLAAIPWKRGLRELQKGTSFALLPPYKHIEKRSYIWPYSVPMMKEHVVAFCHKDINLSDHIKPQTVKNTKPLYIGVNAGYLILNKKLEQAKKANNISILENKSTSANIKKLFYNRLNCYINDKYSTIWELKNIAKEIDINFDNIKESLLVMTQTAHIGYTNNPSHPFEFKDDFIIRMDEALSSVLSSKVYREIINRYVLFTESKEK